MHKYTTVLEIEQAKQIEDVKQGIAPRNMECFAEVAAVIGKEKAEIELAKIDQFDLGVNFEDTMLLDAFCWCTTPQGGSFWNNIDDGINPYGNP